MKKNNYLFMVLLLPFFMSCSIQNSYFGKYSTDIWEYQISSGFFLIKLPPKKIGNILTVYHDTKKQNCAKIKSVLITIHDKDSILRFSPSRIHASGKGIMPISNFKFNTKKDTLFLSDNSMISYLQTILDVDIKKYSIRPKMLKIVTSVSYYPCNSSILETRTDTITAKIKRQLVVHLVH